MPPVNVRPGERQPREPLAALSPHLLADLADWQVHLHARSFTRVSVDMLLHDLRQVVPSALGYTMVLVPGLGLPEVSIAVAEARLTSQQVRSSLGFDLPVAHDISASVTFFAAGADAFDQLATLLGASSTFSSGQVRLAGPPDADVEPGVRGLDDHTSVNYALGILLARGRSLDQAHRHLRGLAEQLGSLSAAAEHVLRTFAA